MLQKQTWNWPKTASNGQANGVVSGRADDVCFYNLEVTLSHLLKIGLVKILILKHGRLDPL